MMAVIQKINMRSSYKWYSRESTNPLPIKTYMHIITGFLAFKMQKVLQGFQVQLSGGNSLGVLAIVGKKPKITVDEKTGKVKGLAPDWKKTKEMWATNPEAKEQKKLAYHFNEHTNGYRFNFVWWKTDMKIGNKGLYSLTLCKPAKRQLTKLLKSGKEYLTHT